MCFFKDRFKNAPKANTTIGLDIGSSTIKWVSLGNNNELKQYAIQEIPMSLSIAQTKDIPQIAAVLKETLFDQNPIRNCIINIPDIFVCCKWIQIDSVNYQRIEKTIRVLAEQIISYPLCKLYFDYQVFDPPPQNQEKYNVLLVACRKEHLDFRLEIIQQANLIPIIVEVGSFALERAFNFFYTDEMNENVILLDIGVSQLTFLFFIHSQSQVYSENLCNVLEFESVLLQIKRCIKRYTLAYPYYVLTKLLLIGANISLLNYILNRLDGFLKLQIRILEYPKQLKYNPELNSEGIERSFMNLFLSYGLALRGNSL
ncbi:MAG: hypothetical protein E6K54_04025 [Gammaproteobacteria bacterium]|nr:MAG: hypothetical protein E6K54_04025 [Gammaproteobacteria bacterium]